MKLPAQVAAFQDRLQEYIDAHDPSKWTPEERTELLDSEAEKLAAKFVDSAEAAPLVAKIQALNPGLDDAASKALAIVALKAVVVNTVMEASGG